MTNNLTPNGAQPTLAGGWLSGTLPQGCQLCQWGAKIVYFMGGDCPRPPHCNWYCPISEERKSADAHFVDEIPIANPELLDATMEALVYEAKAVGALGMSFTGGDPLSSSLKVERVLNIIRLMKVEFGEEFHTHLYTSGKTFDSTIAERLDEAGLDNLRFHPAEEDFPKIELAVGHRYSVGAEVPVIPTEDNHQYLLQLGDFLQNIGADFLNLNEFEMCAPNQEALLDRGYAVVPDAVAAVEGSKEYARRFLADFLPTPGFSVHFCTAALKDSVQIRERYCRRAERVALPYESISDDGCLMFLQIQGAAQEIKRLHAALHEESGVPLNMMGVNLSQGTLQLPMELGEDEAFLEFLGDFHVKAGVYEVLPFREPKFAEVREYTPIMDQLPSKRRNGKKKDSQRHS